MRPRRVPLQVALGGLPRARFVAALSQQLDQSPRGFARQGATRLLGEVALEPSRWHRSHARRPTPSGPAKTPRCPPRRCSESAVAPPGRPRALGRLAPPDAPWSRASASRARPGSRTSPRSPAARPPPAPHGSGRPSKARGSRPCARRLCARESARLRRARSRRGGFRLAGRGCGRGRDVGGSARARSAAAALADSSSTEPAVSSCLGRPSPVTSTLPSLTLTTSFSVCGSQLTRKRVPVTCTTNGPAATCQRETSRCTTCASMCPRSSVRCAPSERDLHHARRGVRAGHDAGAVREAQALLGVARRDPLVDVAGALFDPETQRLLRARPARPRKAAPPPLTATQAAASSP